VDYRPVRTSQPQPKKENLAQSRKGLEQCRLNGAEIGGSEIELLNPAPGTSPTTDKNKFTISAKELISPAFADVINRLLTMTVLTPGQELATLIAGNGNAKLASVGLWVPAVPGTGI
jgi:hypothetical protein